MPDQGRRDTYLIKIRYTEFQPNQSKRWLSKKEEIKILIGQLRIIYIQTRHKSVWKLKIKKPLEAKHRSINKGYERAILIALWDKKGTVTIDREDKEVGQLNETTEISFESSELQPQKAVKS